MSRVVPHSSIPRIINSLPSSPRRPHLSHFLNIFSAHLRHQSIVTMDSQGSPPAADQLSDDEEALPKPLKIIKKRQNKKLDSSIESPSLTIPQLPTVQDSKAGAEININDGSSSSTVQNLQLGPLIPSRNGSLLRSRTHTSILKRSPALPPQSINGIDTLTVQAQGKNIASNPVLEHH